MNHENKKELTLEAYFSYKIKFSVGEKQTNQVLGCRMGKLEKGAWPSPGTGWQLFPVCELLSAVLDPNAVSQISLDSTGFTKHEPESWKEKRVNGYADLTSSCFMFGRICCSLLLFWC